MKKFLLLTLLTALNTQAAITELASYKDLELDQIDADTLVVFDIDNTLLRQNSVIGTHQWGDFMRDRTKFNGADAQTAATAGHEAFAEVQSYVSVVATEEEVHSILAHLENRKIAHFALTARPAKLQATTIEQLKVLDHNFEQAFPEQKDPHLMKAYLKNGIIFSGGTPKGELLKQIVENAVQKPKKIIFIDDKSYNLESVELSLKDYPVQLISYRYGAADVFIENFDPAKANMVYSFFKEYGYVMDTVNLDMNIQALANLRFSHFLEDHNGLLTDIGECQSNTVLVYTCNYEINGTPASVDFIFKNDAFSNTIYFGEW